MKKLTITVLAMLAFGALGATKASAQVTGQATVTIPSVLEITGVTDLTIAGFDFSGGNSSTATGQTTVDTRGNVPHAVNVALGSDLTNGAGDTFVLDVVTTSGLSPLGTGALEVATLLRGVHATAVQFEATADLGTDAPGTYTGQITYTVVPN